MPQGPDVVPGANRPPDLALRQQRLKAWKPILDPTWVIAALLIIAAIFIPVGKSKADTGPRSFSSLLLRRCIPQGVSYSFGVWMLTSHHLSVIALQTTQSLQAKCHVQ